MSVHFRPAKRGSDAVLLGIGGPSRSGKTYSALRIAMGMTGGDPSKIFFIDTERGRARIYVDQFGPFMHYELHPPFSSLRYMEAIEAAEAAGAAVIIVDSASHEHEGPGGILEQHDAELERMAGNDWKKRERMKFAAWIQPKKAHNAYVNRLLQVQCHVIFCYRAKEKLVMVPGQGPVSAGLRPIITDGMEYEMTGMLMLPENAKGVPDFDAPSTALRSGIDTVIQPGRQLDEEIGRALAAWAGGAKKEPQKTAEKTTAPDKPEDADQVPARELYEDLIDKLLGCETMDQLQTAWVGMQPTLKRLSDSQRDDVVMAKDDKKAELENGEAPDE